LEVRWRGREVGRGNKEREGSGWRKVGEVEGDMRRRPDGVLTLREVVSWID
jgi:hypothetical protein